MFEVILLYNIKDTESCLFNNWKQFACPKVRQQDMDIMPGFMAMKHDR